MRDEKGEFFEVTFLVAMQNRRAVASYLHPQTILSERNEFLIVSRSGGKNQFLSVSNAGACTGFEDEAPKGIQPELFMCATLISQGPDGEQVFLIEQAQPETFEAKGRFVGGDGYCVLSPSPSGLFLQGAARLKPGALSAAAADKCVLLGDGEAGAALHFDAAYIPWADEVLPPGFTRPVKPFDTPGPQPT
ncbi:MAG: hypothetical protein AAF678_11060 [Pseudomonadota bacterium]